MSPSWRRMVVVDDDLDAGPSDDVAQLPDAVRVARVDHDDAVDRVEVEPLQVDEVEELLVQVVKRPHVGVLAAEEDALRAREELRRRDRRGVRVEVGIRVSDDDLHRAPPSPVC